MIVIINDKGNWKDFLLAPGGKGSAGSRCVSTSGAGVFSFAVNEVGNLVYCGK